MRFFKSKYVSVTLSIFLFISFILGTNIKVLAYTVSAKWIDRSQFQVDTIQFDDNDHTSLGFNLSTESDQVKNKYGNPKLDEIVNNENKGTYKSGDILSQNFEYKKGVCDNAEAIIDLGGGNIDQSKGDVVVQKLKWNFSDQGFSSSGCHNFAKGQGLVKASITISDSQNKDIWFNSNSDRTQLNRVDAKDGDYKTRTGDNPNILYASQGQTCSDGFLQRVIIDDATKNQDIMTGTYKTCSAQYGSGPDGDIAVKITKTPNGNPPGVNPTGTGGGVATPTCESNNKNVLLSWILCGVVNAIDNSVNSIKDSVDGLLDVRQDEYDNPQIKAIWSYFKNIASFMLIGVALIVIIGQTFNRE